jgi:hypothetical protein
MKTVMRVLKQSVRFSRSRQAAFAAAVFCLLLAIACTAVFADRGRGSIRASARPVVVQREPVRAPPPVAERRDVHPAPVHVEAPRDWDDNDEDARHFGGFAGGVPARVMRGQRIHDLPAHYVHLAFNNVNYFIDDVGAYYLQQPDGEYLVVQPPVGIIVAALPSGAVPIQVGPTVYYYLDGDFYVAQDSTFAVVNPPPGIVVPTLPAGASQVVVNGNVVYQFNGFNYQPALQDGVTVYTVNPA